MSKVAIILSSYNGSKYIREQIDSLLAQTYQTISVFIRDDGSSDGTAAMLSDVYQNEPRVKLVWDVSGVTSNKNLGFGNSFSTTVRAALSDNEHFDYIAFCDQDDFWEPEKISSAISALSAVDSSKPCLYASNYFICDEKLEAKTTFNDGTPMAGVTFPNLFFEGVFPGFCIVINRTLAELAFINDPVADIFYHDKWVTLIALGHGGEIIYDNTPLARYRRHEAAASSTDLGFAAKLKWRINNVLNGDFCPRTKQMLYEYKRCFYSDSSDEIKVFLDTFTGNSKLKKLFFKSRLRRSSSGELLMRLILLTGKL